jgi:NADH:ubiquinone oxidoreductase subunit 3 (subunit A)
MMNIKLRFTVFLITTITLLSTAVLIKLLQLYTHETMGAILFTLIYFMVYQFKKSLETN